MSARIDPPQENEISIREYWDIFLKRRAVFAITAAVMFGIQLIFILQKPPFYESTAKVMIGPSTIQVRSLTGSFIFQRYEAQNELELMKSDTVIRRAAEELKDESKGQFILSPEDIKEDLKVEINRDKSGYMTNIIKMSAQSLKPQLSLYILNSVLKAYIAENEKYRTTVIKEAYDAATQQLAMRRKELEGAERIVTKFVLEHDILARGVEITTNIEKDKRTGREQTKGIEARIDEKYLELKSQRIDREAFLEEVKRNRAKDEVITLGVIAKREPNLVDSTLRDVLYGNERKLSKLRLTQSELHPNVIEAKGEVEEAGRRISDEVDRAIDSLERDVGALKKQEEKLYTLIKEGLSDVMVEYASLRRDVDAKRETYNNFIKQLQELNLTEKFQRAQPLKILEAPMLPIKPSSSKIRFVLQAIIISLIAGVGVILFMENIDITIKNVDDIEDGLGISVLATIPMWKKKPVEAYLGLVSILNPKSVISEAFRTLRTNLKFVGLDRKLRSLVITSTAPEEGKSTVSCNLASIMAMSGEKVILIDADLRRASVHRHFNLDNSWGLSTILASGDSTKNVKVSDTRLETLKVITAGPVPPNPSELLESKNMNALLEKLKESYDMIVLDSTPILTVTDGLIMAAKSDGVIVVFSANKTVKKAGLRTCRLLKNAGDNILGAVLNMVEPKGSNYYGGYYYYNKGYYGKKEIE